MTNERATKEDVLAVIRTRYEHCNGHYNRIINHAWKLHADIGILLAMLAVEPDKP